MSNAAPVKSATAAQWKKAAVHTIRVPSGVFIDIKIPDLAALIEAGKIPQNLIDAALGYASRADGAEKTTIESVAEDRQFRDVLVSMMTVEPKLSPEDVADIPTEDKYMLAEIALRQRDIDAEGEHIGGLMASEKFRKFRGFDDIDSVLAGS